MGEAHPDVGDDVVDRHLLRQRSPMRAASAGSSAMKSTSSPTVLTTRPPPAVTTSEARPSKRWTRTPSSCCSSRWDRRVYETRSAKPTVSGVAVASPRLRRVGQPADGRGEVPAPHVQQQLLEVVGQRAEPVEGLLRPGTAGAGEVLEQRLGVPAHQPVRGLAEGAREGDRGGLVDEPRPHERGDPAERLHVAVRERDVGVGDVREPEGAPQLARRALRHAGPGRDLAPAPAPAAAQEPLLQVAGPPFPVPAAGPRLAGRGHGRRGEAQDARPLGRVVVAVPEVGGVEEALEGRLVAGR